MKTAASPTFPLDPNEAPKTHKKKIICELILTDLLNK